jgi:hypothetical protein
LEGHLNNIHPDLILEILRKNQINLEENKWDFVVTRVIQGIVFFQSIPEWLLVGKYVRIIFTHYLNRK